MDVWLMVAANQRIDVAPTHALQIEWTDHHKRNHAFSGPAPERFVLHRTQRCGLVQRQEFIGIVVRFFE